MKQFFIAILILISLNINAQEEILGFGVIKIGKSLSEITKDLNIKKNKILGDQKCADLTFSDILNLKKPILFRYDTTDKTKYEFGLQYYITCGNACKLLIPEYVISDVKITRLELSFYNDTLYSIKFEPSKDFLDLFEIKYGKGKEKVEKKIVKCSSKYAGTLEFKDQYYTTEWDSKGKRNLSALYILSSYRDDSCKEKFFSTFLINDLDVSSKVRKCEIEYDNVRREKVKLNQKQKIKDF